jgi:hypothetical protein
MIIAIAIAAEIEGGFFYHPVRAQFPDLLPRFIINADLAKAESIPEGAFAIFVEDIPDPLHEIISRFFIYIGSDRSPFIHGVQHTHISQLYPEKQSFHAVYKPGI